MRLALLTLFIFGFIHACAQLPKIENNQLVPDKAISFKPGTSELTDEGIEALKPVKEFLIARDYVSLMRVEGHSDNSGNESDNQKLTEQRAMSVCRWLVTNGIDCKRLIPVGFGSTKPLASNDTMEGRAANRRLVFALASLRGRLIGGMPADGGGAVAGDSCKNE